MYLSDQPTPTVWRRCNQQSLLRVYSCDDVWYEWQQVHLGALEAIRLQHCWLLHTQQVVGRAPFCLHTLNPCYSANSLVLELLSVAVLVPCQHNLPADEVACSAYCS